MTFNPNTYNPLEYLLEKYPDKEWYWIYLTRNPNINMKYIENNMDKPWVFRYLGHNPNMNIEFVKNHPEFKNLCTWILSHENIKATDIDYIINNFKDEHGKLILDGDDYWEFISINPNLTIEFLKKYNDKPINWHHIVLYSKIEAEILDFMVVLLFHFKKNIDYYQLEKILFVYKIEI